MHTKKGTSLIELILYIAIISIFLTGMILFTWDLVYGRVKTNIQQEVTYNISLASKRLQYDIKNADGVNKTDGSTLSLNYAVSDPWRDPTIFSLENGRIMVQTGSNDPYPLTGNRVVVTDLNFTQHSITPETENVEFYMRVQSASSGRQELEKFETYTTSVEVRSL